ncbi:MAG: hypothetical protein GY862_19820 [Gammaproteobacteria bacterium]|nr:hypothetical protein [Gammaproteobacteria bacterium]
MRAGVKESYNRQGGGLQRLYREEFARLQGDKKKFAGSRDFDEFAKSETGRTLLKLTPLSLEQAFDWNGEEEAADVADEEAEALEEAVFSEEAAKSGEAEIEILIETCPKLSGDPVMKYLFREGIGKGVPLCSTEEAEGVLKNPEFRKLLAVDRRYTGLSGDKLANKLYRDAMALIDRCDSAD